MRAGRNAAVLVSTAVAVAVVAAGAAACVSGDSELPGAQPLPSDAPSPTPSPTSGTGGGTGGGSDSDGLLPGPSGTTPPPSSTVCWTSELTGSILDSNGAAGTVYLELALTNSSGEACTVRGFPGVSFVDEHGRQLGAAANRNGVPGPSISLAPGQQAVAVLGVTQPGVLPGCDPGQTTRPASLLIYPPDNRDPLRVPVTSGAVACTDPAVHQLKIATLELIG